MNIKKIYIDFRKNFYINKLENLLNDYNFFESIKKRQIYYSMIIKFQN